MRRKATEISEGKQKVIAGLINEYGIKTAEDIQNALKDLLGGTIQKMLESELEEQLSEEREGEQKNTRNGYKSKTLRSKSGKIPIRVPQDRASEFEPQVVKKHKRDISDIEGKIIAMYGRGMTTNQISEQIEDIYGFDVSESMVSAITNKLLPEIEAWQQRPLERVYPIVYIDAVHFSVREDHMIKKLAAYIVMGVSESGKKEVLSICVGENESSKYWLNMFNELKNRGVQDIFVMCTDGLSGITNAIEVAFPKTEHQRCIVHMVRNTLKHVGHKNKKEFANDLKTIYHAPSEQVGYERMKVVSNKWESQYPNSMKRWEDNWVTISPMFKFSANVRKVIYTTNAIESLNSGYRRLNKTRSVFPSSTSLLKALYLATFQLTKKWTGTVRDWSTVYGELSIMYPDRML